MIRPGEEARRRVVGGESGTPLPVYDDGLRGIALQHETSNGVPVESLLSQLGLFHSSEMSVAFQQDVPGLILDATVDAIVELPFVKGGWTEP